MLVLGWHAIEESLRRGARGELLLCRRNARIARLEELAARSGLPVRSVAREELDRLSGGADHRGAAFRLEEDAARPGSSFRQGPAGLGERLAGLAAPTALLLLLDELSDPHNLGAVLRSADQFGVALVALTSRRSVRETETVLRTSSGASLYVPLAAVPNLVQAMELAKKAGFWIYGADLHGERLDSVRFEGPTALVLGSEGYGLRRLVRERCDTLVRIPAGGHVDSFNVSVAAGILMYEIRRQQGFAGSR
jgi:23S rRNA (guanosine2251-2'-O)-methyltransferase